jgi:hypothetical protein
MVVMIGQKKGKNVSKEEIHGDSLAVDTGFLVASGSSAGSAPADGLRLSVE